jgi:hypothetical protein
MHLPFVPAALVAWALAVPARAGENLLKNGDFESGGRDAATVWAPIWPRQIQDPAPEFGHPEEGAHSGASCGTLETFKPGGYSSYTQEVRGEEQANVAVLRGWVRLDEVASGSSASFLLLFLDDKGEMISMHATRSVAEVCDWTQLELEVGVPAGARTWLVRCGVTGQARAAFDDVELLAERVRGELVQAKLVVHHGTYQLRAPQACKEPWIALSIPFPFERQTPLGLRVTSTPPEQVARLEVFEDGQNRPLRVVLVPQERGAEVALRVETLAMVVDRPLSDGEGVELLASRRAPKEVKDYLAAAPGLDLDEALVLETAQTFERTDLASLLRGVTAFLKSKLQYAGGGSQGAKECLESGKAVCTGYANVATTLLIAAGVPTRILASTQTSGRLQEHYIVEVWTKALGWSRVESTMATFPWADTNNLILRVVGPDSWRSPADVPLYVETGGGAQGGFDLDPSDICWQGAETLATLQVQQAGFEALEAQARKGFEGLGKRSAEGAQAGFLPDEKARKKLKLGERTARLLVRALEWMQGP